MIKLVVLKVLLLFSNIYFGQITTTKVAESKPIEIEPYDSLKNFLGSDFKKTLVSNFILFLNQNP